MNEDYLDTLRNKKKYLEEVESTYCKTKKEKDLLQARIDAYQEMIDEYYSLYKKHFKEDYEGFSEGFGEYGE